MMERQQLLNIVEGARLAGRPDFARTAAADWLAAWPGDVEVQFRLAQSEVEQGLNAAACARLTAVLSADPECCEAYDLIATALRAQGDPTQAQVYAACAQALRGEELDRWKTPSWGFGLARALQALKRGEAEAADKEIQACLTADPSVPLPAVVAVRSLVSAGNRPAAFGLARSGHDRWPECVVFLLVVADDLLGRGETARGVEYLHRAAAQDPTGKITGSVLGGDHAYIRLWPARMDAEMTHPIPAEVAAQLGENRLGVGPSAPATTVAAPSTPAAANPAKEASATVRRRPDSRDPEPGAPAQPNPPSPGGEDDLPRPEPWEAFRGPNPGDGEPEAEAARADMDSVRQEFNRLASKLRAKNARSVPHEDSRLPAYIAISSRSRLSQVFGEQTFRRVDAAILELIETVRRRPRWSAYRIYIDDPTSLAPFGLAPADPQNAWQIKLRLADLDRALRDRGEMVGSLLIVGGDKVVPFHQLPNPTDDDDETIPSDNPYASTDENYFAPEWPVGRLPWEESADALVAALERATQEHRLQNHPGGRSRRLRFWLQQRVGMLTRRQLRSLGYSASIWKKASMAVYRPIGDPASLLTSPPTQADRLPTQAIRPTRFSYYNLHGVEDAPEWFGQRDPLHDDKDSSEFPVALRPQDIVNSGRAPAVVFTEACFGANVVRKTSQTAIALKFLASGSLAVVGSTKTSYGSIAPPLIAADLLGRLFWEHLNRGLPVGEALRRAKLGLAGEMHRRQGYLDGEDQKTLIAFVLFGDPLLALAPRRATGGDKLVIRRSSRPMAMKTACALGGPQLTPEDLDPATAERIRSVVARYLPGMTNAQCRIHTQHPGCDGDGHTCPTHQLGLKSAPGSDPHTLQVTLSKQVVDGAQRHPHFARLTLDASGKILKLAVSK